MKTDNLLAIWCVACCLHKVAGSHVWTSCQKRHW